MKTADVIYEFATLSCEEQARTLARLAYELTIVAREAYEVGSLGVSSPAKLRVINEIQHRVTSFLTALLTHDPFRYPDDVLVKIVLEHPSDLMFQQQLATAFERALSPRRAFQQANLRDYSSPALLVPAGHDINA